MVTLFFFLSFINTLLDSLGSSLVITAVGGGTAVIPFLTVYAVWPASFVFLVLYSFATQRFSRGALFNIVVAVFMAWFVAFGFLYPFHETMHFHGMAESMLEGLPSGLAGAVGMVRNWMFTTFYVGAEMWGDVVLSLLFWGLANEMTTMREAPLLYPLFGIGANIGQTVSGKALSTFSTFASSRLSYATQLQGIMALVVVFSFVVLGLHAYITHRFPSNILPEPDLDTIPALEAKPTLRRTSPATQASSQGGVHLNGAAVELEADASSRLRAGSEASTSGTASPGAAAVKAVAAGGKKKAKLSLRDAVIFLTKSPQIQCLAVMALAQGLSTNLIEIAWKSHLHMLHPSPAAYSAFLGEVATWTGIVTGTLMFASPALFARWKWRGVAGATPAFMLWTGLPFFVGCVLYNVAHPGQSLVGTAALRALVIVGAILQVFAKGAKFSMFKPAEEMVYIGLDEQSRTKGKAAIDVVGAQTGKSVGSVLQQVLLVVSSGSLVKSLPVMAMAYFAILRSWSRSVHTLSTLHVCAFTTHSMSIDEESDDEGEPAPEQVAVLTETTLGDISPQSPLAAL
ncbi:ADP,ATP carrier protein 1 [Coccomyxa sp. Obi]|nr:ADP,ATP carrier protein 1 [Coccomyxa sp. Obi]